LTSDELPIRWGTRDWYYEALRIGVSDPRAIAKACALVDAAYALVETTGIEFDTAVQSILLGYISYTDTYQEVMTLKWRLKLAFDSRGFKTRWTVQRVTHRVSVQLATSITKSKRHISTGLSRLKAGFWRIARTVNARRKRSKPEKGDGNG
jgi:hypothetical protein